MPAPTGINSTKLYGRFRVFRGDVCREIGCSKMLAICCIQSFERSRTYDIINLFSLCTATGLGSMGCSFLLCFCTSTRHLKSSRHRRLLRHWSSTATSLNFLFTSLCTKWLTQCRSSRFGCLLRCVVFYAATRVCVLQAAVMKLHSDAEEVNWVMLGV